MWYDCQGDNYPLNIPDDIDLKNYRWHPMTFKKNPYHIIVSYKRLWHDNIYSTIKSIEKAMVLNYAQNNTGEKKV